MGRPAGDVSFRKFLLCMDAAVSFNPNPPAEALNEAYGNTRAVFEHGTDEELTELVTSADKALKAHERANNPAARPGRQVTKEVLETIRTTFPAKVVAAFEANTLSRDDRDKVLTAARAALKASKISL